MTLAAQAVQADTSLVPENIQQQLCALQSQVLHFTCAALLNRCMTDYDRLPVIQLAHRQASHDVCRASLHVLLITRCD